MPSNSIDNCARVRETLPSVACGQINFPLSRRLQNKHRPSPSNQISFTRSPLRPRKMNTCPDSGLFSSLVCTSALSPSKPRRRSVTPAAIQICVLLGGPIIAPGTPTPPAPTLHLPLLRPALVPSAVGCESCLWMRMRPRKPYPTGCLLLAIPQYSLALVTASPHVD